MQARLKVKTDRIVRKSLLIEKEKIARNVARAIPQNVLRTKNVRKTVRKLAAAKTRKKPVNQDVKSHVVRKKKLQIAQLLKKQSIMKCTKKWKWKTEIDFPHPSKEKRLLALAVFFLLKLFG